MKKAKQAGTLTMTVTLDTAANPNVEISKRVEVASAGTRLKWIKKNTADNFTMDSFSPKGAGEAFKEVTVGGNGQWLSAKFTPDTPSKKYPYTLTVKSGNKKYNSTEQSASPDPRRPVIRNTP